MSLNILKLCVGVESLEQYQGWAKQRVQTLKASKSEVQLFHTTRMVPKRVDELLDGGSLFWVIKGQIQARQKLVDIRPFVDDGGIRRCKLMLGNEVIPTQWYPKRAFQGWRYLKGDEAPDDLGQNTQALPAHLRSELAELGLL